MQEKLEKSISFDRKCSFQNTSRKLARIPSLANSIHPCNHCTSNWTFCNCYENLDEKWNETISLWQQCSSSTWIKPKRFSPSLSLICQMKVQQGCHLSCLKLNYSEVPNRRACSLRFFRFCFTLLAIFHVINEKFHPVHLLIYLVKNQAGWKFFQSCSYSCYIKLSNFYWIQGYLTIKLTNNGDLLLNLLCENKRKLFCETNCQVTYVCYTQYPIIRNADQRWALAFLKNYQFPDADHFLILQGWGLAVS